MIILWQFYHKERHYVDYIDLEFGWSEKPQNDENNKILGKPGVLTSYLFVFSFWQQ